MELSEVVNANFAVPVVGVVVCALLVFAFGFKSPGQPPSFDSLNDDDDDKKLARKSKRKHKPNIDGHIIYIDNHTSQAAGKGSLTKPQSPFIKQPPGGEKTLEKIDNQQSKLKTKKQKSVEINVEIKDEVIKEVEVTGDWTKAKSKKERKNRGKKDESGKDGKIDESKKEEIRIEKHEIHEPVVKVIQISQPSSNRDSTSPAIINRKINEITVTAPAPQECPLVNDSAQVCSLVNEPAQACPLLNKSATTAEISISKVKVDDCEPVKPQVTVTDTKKSPKVKPVQVTTTVVKAAMTEVVSAPVLLSKKSSKLPKEKPAQMMNALSKTAPTEVVDSPVLTKKTPKLSKEKPDQVMTALSKTAPTEVVDSPVLTKKSPKLSKEKPDKVMTALSKIAPTEVVDTPVSTKKSPKLSKEKPDQVMTALSKIAPTEVVNTPASTKKSPKLSKEKPDQVMTDVAKTAPTEVVDAQMLAVESPKLSKEKPDQVTTKVAKTSSTEMIDAPVLTKKLPPDADVVLTPSIRVPAEKENENAMDTVDTISTELLMSAAMNDSLPSFPSDQDVKVPATKSPKKKKVPTATLR